MKRKCGIALMSMILFILFCNVVFAEDGEIYDLREGELYVIVVSYDRDPYYECFMIFKGTHDREHVTTIISIPEKSYDIKTYSYGEYGEIRTNFKIIKTIKELDEFFEKYPTSPKDYSYTLENLEGARKHNNILLGIIHPSDLNIEDEFKIKIIYKINIDNQSKSYYYWNWLGTLDGSGITISGNVKELDRLSFILPTNARPWYQKVKGSLQKLPENREALSWQIGENNIQKLVVTFGIPEERIHWENYVSDIRNFIYIMMGIFLTITVPIMLTKTKFEKSKRIKYCILYLALPIFVIFLSWRIITFKLREIPLETCFQGKCLKVEIICALIILSIIYFILIKFSYLCINREGKEENLKLEKKQLKRNSSQKKERKSPLQRKEFLKKNHEK